MCYLDSLNKLLLHNKKVTIYCEKIKQNYSSLRKRNRYSSRWKFSSYQCGKKVFKSSKRRNCERKIKKCRFSWVNWRITGEGKVKIKTKTPNLSTSSNSVSSNWNIYPSLFKQEAHQGFQGNPMLIKIFSPEVSWWFKIFILSLISCHSLAQPVFLLFLSPTKRCSLKLLPLLKIPSCNTLLKICEPCIGFCTACFLAPWSVTIFNWILSSKSLRSIRTFYNWEWCVVN